MSIKESTISPTAAVRRLCCLLTGEKDENVETVNKLALRIVTSKPIGFTKALPDESDEFSTLCSMKKKLVELGHGPDIIDHFMTQYNVLHENMENASLRCNILRFFLELCVTLNSSKSNSSLTDIFSIKKSLREPPSKLWKTDSPRLPTVGGKKLMILSKQYDISKKTSLTTFDHRQLVHDIVFTFQGVDGKYLTFEKDADAYTLSCEVVGPSRMMALRLSDVGWIVRKLMTFIQDKDGISRKYGVDMPACLVSHALVAAVREDLHSFRRAVAALDSQARNQENALTLLRLQAWQYGPCRQMVGLLYIIEGCRGKRGGQIISHIYMFLHHGDPCLRETALRLLRATCAPLIFMIVSWLIRGEITDVHGEFFITASPYVRKERIWHDKYALRHSMVPSFIDEDFAMRMLEVGKCIDFLRNACNEEEAVFETEKWKHAIEKTPPDALFAKSESSQILEAAVEEAYHVLNQRVLQTMERRFHLTQHFDALRRYLLLSQGDFAHHLIRLLAPILSAPSSTLLPHVLTTALDTAVRSTSAQWEDNDIINRLDIRLLEVSPGDPGWDAFTLEYQTRGPLAAILTPQAVATYRHLFAHLWRAKRADYVLGSAWQRQCIVSQMCWSEIPELVVLLRSVEALVAEMSHFVQQTQAYLSGEAIACSWKPFVKDMSSAKTLTELSEAHSRFLQRLSARFFLDSASSQLLNRLRSLLTLVVDCHEQVSIFHVGVENEVSRRLSFKEKIVHGLSPVEELDDKRKRNSFTEKIVRPVKTNIVLLAESFHDLIKNLLDDLAKFPDDSLQSLRFRLDFNGHYEQLAQKKARKAEK